MGRSMTNSQQTEKKNLTLFQVIGSIFASMFGVQSNANRERDFEHGKASTFIYGGIIFLVLFVLAVWGVVQIVLNTAGAQ